MDEILDYIEKPFSNTLPDLNSTIEESIDWLTARGVSPHTLYLTRFIIEEMGTNILKYGYDDDDKHLIQLKLSLTSTILKIVLIDDGHEFNPIEAPQPKTSGSIEERTPGGLGIWLVQKFGKLLYKRENNLNYVEVDLKLDCVTE
jgi:anti-sigma regulatory factor (Ser/Thr protein kinase)